MMNGIKLCRQSGGKAINENHRVRFRVQGTGYRVYLGGRREAMYVSNVTGQLHVRGVVDLV